MAHLILHAGLPKTGTSTLQATLSKPSWDSLLSGHDIHYLKHPSLDTDSSRYFHSLCGQPKWASTAAHECDVSAFTEALHIAKEGVPANDAILIVAEAVSSLARREERLAQVRDFLARFFSDVTVIVYVREPLSYMCSRIQQALKSGYPLSTALDNVVKDADFTTKLQNLRHLFGAAEVTIRSFDPANLIDGEIVTDFCLGALAIPDSPTLRHRIESRTVRNYSIPQELMGLLLSLYRHKSIAAQDVPRAFSEGISDMRWAGSEFGLSFFSRQDRHRLVAAAEDARNRLRRYLGRDCFPSYRPVGADALEELRPLPWKASTFRQYIVQLRLALDALGATREGGDGRYSNDRGMDTLDGARSEAYRLLDRFHELCKRSKQD